MLDKKNDDMEPEELQQIAQSFSDLNLLVNETMPNLQDIQNHIRNDIEANEELLDRHCEDISRDILVEAESKSKPNGIRLTASKESLNAKVLPLKFTEMENKPIKRTPIDPQKKSKLLAVLKSIDSTGALVQ